MSEYRKYGFDAALPKPYAMGELARAIKEVLSAAGGQIRK
jgi:DNA-binding response OmpR family regulator